MAETLSIGGVEVAPGTRRLVELDLPPLYTHTPLRLPLHVVRGRRDGATLLLSAAIHGDELNGIEIIRRVLARRALQTMRGTLIAVPIVNVLGVLRHSRYLPDGRDLNRSFPGSERGSTTARIADLFLREVVRRCSHGIDLHTGSGHRRNLPQIRANLDDEETLRLALAFNTPVVINARIRDGSLRAAASDIGVPLLLYEAGECLRFDELCIRAGVRGVLGVMRALEMIRGGPPESVHSPFIARGMRWVRAPSSGIVRSALALGTHVEKGQVLARIGDPFGVDTVPVRAPDAGVIIGNSQIPLVHEGDALFNIAGFDEPASVAESVEAFHDEYTDA